MIKPLSIIPGFLARPLFTAALIAASLYAPAATPDRASRLSPLATGYLERAEIMLDEGNYAGVIDQLKHLDTQGVTLPAGEQADCAYLLALALYQRGDADCVDLLRQYAEAYPASPQALPARLAAADYFFFSHSFSSALAAYEEIDYTRINPAERPLYDYRKALSMLRTGHYDEARTIFRQLQANKDFNLAAEYYLAYCDYVEGNFDDAYKSFSEIAKRTANCHVEGIDPEFYLAQIEYRQGHYEEVTGHGKALLAVGAPRELEPETVRVVGLSYFKLGDYTQASKYLRRYMRYEDIEPAPDAAYALGVIEYSEGDYEQASGRFSTLTDLDNDLAQSAYLYLGQIAIKENDSNAAAISFEKASKMKFDSEVSEAALFNYIAARTHGGNIPFSSSIPLLTGFLKDYPRSKYAPQVEEYLATAYFNEKDYARALESINKIPDPSAKTLEAKQKILYELGMEAMTNSRPQAAREYLTEGVRIGGDPSLRAQSYLWLGDACYTLGDYQEAEKAYQAYLKADRRGENRTLAQYNLAYTQLMQGKYTQAASGFATSLKADPLLPQRMYDDALIRMADAQYYAGDYRLALKNYTTAIENGATDADYATFRRAVMYGLAGDIKTKLSELSALPSRYPNSKWLPNALLEKGQTYTGLGETANAVTAFEQLRTTYRQSAEARKGMLSLAMAYMKERNYPQGEETYKEIIVKWPSSEEARLANDDLRRHYSSTGGLQEYAAFLRNVPEAPQIDASEMETLSFEGAETVFSENVTDVALLEKYVADYPNGVYLARALLDIAIGKDEADDADGSLEAIDTLIARRGDSPEIPEALLLKARLLEEKGPASRKEATAAYRELERRGGPDYAADAYAGIMRNTDKPEERLRYAAIVKESGGLSADQIEEAEFYEASAALSKSADKKAIATMRRLAANPKSLYGARAAVELGQHFIDNGAVSDAEKLLTAFTDAGSPHEYWLARGFIALADVYHKQGKTYLAVEYLKSLRDNYPGSELDIHDMIATRLKNWK